MNATDYRRFIEVWYASRTFAEVAATLGLEARSCSNIAAGLRRGGVPLPVFPHVHRGATQQRIDWPALVAWADICAGARMARRYRAS